ncbi:phage antirepressor N-terminal domain-containing protein [Singulisphaera acidiphila]|uniref:phage antirepressor N-terminal domain-containing protein n=1 Tax=Singulisphaera acidiphila TaxID=466153 RepID=UPI0003620B69|nr:phage antirepressor N-terminal domain-containing protein [Singulisphaera acidiphila]
MADDTQGKQIQLAQAPFYGDIVDGTVAHDGTVYVSPKRICESIGLAWTTQFRKLGNARWSRMIMMIIRDSEGRSQQTAMIPLKAVPMWLAGINPSKVKPELRDKLERYQDEVVEVLSAWFLGISDTPGLAK